MGSRSNRPAIEAPFITEEARRLLTFVLLSVFPVLVTVSALWIAHSHDVMSIDFHNELYPEARDVLHGRDPYPLTFIFALTTLQRLEHEAARASATTPNDTGTAADSE